MPKRIQKRAASRARGTEHAAEPTDEHTGSRAFWSGTISFGLVTIPIELFGATRTTRRSLRMLAPSGTPIARRYFTEDGKPVDDETIARGYELDKDEYVVVSDDELERLLPEQSRDIALSRFVDRAAIPPLFFERAYIMAPTGQSNAAYRLLAATLERNGKAGLASFVMRGKQYVVAIVGQDGLLRAETLRFADELRTPEAVGLPAVETASEAHVKRLRAAIAKAVARSVPSGELADTYWQRVEALAKKKLHKHEDFVGSTDTHDPEENLAEVIDLVAVLKKSLGDQGHTNGPSLRSAAKRAHPATASAGPKKAASPRHPQKKRAAGSHAKSGR